MMRSGAIIFLFTSQTHYPAPPQFPPNLRMNLPHLLYLLLLPTLTSSSSTLDLSYTTSTLPSTLPPTVTSLPLSNLNLKTVPPLIDNNLLTVDLSNNLLTLPSVLSVFKSEKIEEINLSFNPLFTSPPLKLNVTTSSIKTLNLSNTVTKTPDHLIKFLTKKLPKLKSK